MKLKSNNFSNVDIILEKAKSRSNLKNKNSNKPKDSKKSADKKKKKKKSLPAGTISTKGAFGSGGAPSRFVADARARAEKDPKGLMKDLGVTSAGGNDISQVLSIFNQAIHSNQIMSRAYTGASTGTASTRDGENIDSAIIVTMAELDRKNGVRFLANTLVAAKNSGILSLSGAIQFAQGSRQEIIVYSA